MWTEYGLLVWLVKFPHLMSSPLQCRERAEFVGRGVGVAATLQFSVFTVAPSKIKMQTIQYRKSRIWEMKEDKIISKKPNQELGACFSKGLETFRARSQI